MADGRLRLFVALELPETVRRALLGWQAEVAGGEPGLRAVSRDSLHITLCFLGSRPAEELPEVIEACRVAEGSAVGDLSLGEALWLPSPRRPRVLAANVVDGRGELAPVQAALSRALIACGAYQPEDRAFLPHVTVARVRRGARVRAGEHEKPGVLEVPRTAGFDAERVTLYRSHLGGGPARYEALHRLELSRR